MVQLHLQSQVVVSGRVNGHSVRDVLRPDTSKAFFLGHPGEEEAYAAIGCDDGTMGVRFSILGPALVSIAGMKTGLKEGVVTDEVTIACPDGQSETNQLNAHYEPGILSRIGLRK